MSTAVPGLFASRSNGGLKDKRVIILANMVEEKPESHQLYDFHIADNLYIRRIATVFTPPR